MRLLYTIVFHAVLPIVLLRLYWRGFKNPQYRLRWLERLGIYSGSAHRNVIWIHAVSVGESEAAFPLIKQLQNRHADAAFLITTTTPTGSARIRSVLGDSVEHVYLPYDLPLIVRRFIRHFQPKIAVFMEKEIWPNLYAACAAENIPVFIINARLSARSAKAYLKIPGLVKPALDDISQIAAQTEDDKFRFIEIGAKPLQLKVLGNIKFDIHIDNEMIAAGQKIKQTLFAGRFVWIIASSHQGEEKIFLDLYAELKNRIPDLLLMIAPRHPERFASVKKLCEDQRLAVAMRSEQPASLLNHDIYLADSMGELKMLYAAADIAFVAGSLAPVGGHNVLEPAAVGTPVLFGPQMFNFQEIADGMLACGAALQCLNATEIGAALLKLHQNPDYRSAMINRARYFVERNQGATERTAALLAEYL